MDVRELKYDIRIISGSTLPVNRWAYLEELKQLMQMGVIDDIALLAETDLKNKENIIKRKSLYSQLQSQLGSLQQSLKDKEGTIETLERQLVQAGIKQKVMQADVEINKKKEEVKSNMNKQYTQTEGEQKLLRNVMGNNANTQMRNLQMDAKNIKNNLQKKETSE